MDDGAEKSQSVHLTRPEGLLSLDSIYPVLRSDLVLSEPGTWLTCLRHLRDRLRLEVRLAGVKTRRNPKQMKRIPASFIPLSVKVRRLCWMS